MALTERRTQIHLTEEQYQAATRLARERGASLAAVVREALDRYVAAARGERTVDWEDDPAATLVGCGSLPPLDRTRDGGREEPSEAIGRLARVRPRP